MSITRASYSLIIRQLHYLLLMFYILIAVNGCHYLEGAGTTLREDGKDSLHNIAIMPFLQISPAGPADEAVRCPVCGVIFRIEKMPDNPEKKVEDIFIKHFKPSEKFNLIPPDRIHGTYERLTMESFKTSYPDILKKVGDEFGADGVIVGYVYRYRERIGYPYSVKQPATVTFDIHLLRVSDGSIVWKGTFDKTQKSLLENILQLPFFFREGGKWLTAEELSEEGIEEILKTFPGMQ